MPFLSYFYLLPLFLSIFSISIPPRHYFRCHFSFYFSPIIFAYSLFLLMPLSRFSSFSSDIILFAAAYFHFFFWLLLRHFLRQRCHYFHLSFHLMFIFDSFLFLLMIFRHFHAVYYHFAIYSASYWYRFIRYCAFAFSLIIAFLFIIDLFAISLFISFIAFHLFSSIALFTFRHFLIIGFLIIFHFSLYIFHCYFFDAITRWFSLIELWHLLLIDCHVLCHLYYFSLLLAADFTPRRYLFLSLHIIIIIFFADYIHYFFSHWYFISFIYLFSIFSLFSIFDAFFRFYFFFILLFIISFIFHFFAAISIFSLIISSLLWLYFLIMLLLPWCRLFSMLSIATLIIYFASHIYFHAFTLRYFRCFIFSSLIFFTFRCAHYYFLWLFSFRCATMPLIDFAIYCILRHMIFSLILLFIIMPITLLFTPSSLILYLLYFAFDISLSFLFWYWLPSFSLLRLLMLSFDISLHCLFS